MDYEELLRNCRILDLGRSLKQGMPQSPNHPPFRMTLERRHGDRMRPGGASGSNEIIITGGHVGTHVDALAHISQDGKLHGCINVSDAMEGGIYKSHGIDELDPVIGRAVMIDAVASLGEDAVKPGKALTEGDLEAALKHHGVELREGDVLLVRTGWGRHWDDNEAYLNWEGGFPGPNADAIAWLADQKVRLVGSDTLAFEHIPPGQGLAELPGHRILLVEHGIPIVECLDLEALAQQKVYEFIFIMAPLKIVGATASPVRPLALVRGGEA